MTFFRLPGRHQATLDELHVLTQKFTRLTVDMNVLESEFLEYQAVPDDEFPGYFDEDDKPMDADYICHQIS